MRTSLLLLLVFANVVLQGCDAQYQWDYVMYNSTLDTIKVLHYNPYGLTRLDTVLIPPSQRQLVYSSYGKGWYGRAGIKDDWFAVETEIDSTSLKTLNVFKNDSVESATNFNVREHWIFKQVNKTNALYLTLVKPQDF